MDRTVCRILVADSNSDSADSLALLLELNGHLAVTAVTGPVALELAALLQPEAVFLSLHLPHVGGLEVARALSAGTHCVRPRLLIAITGDGRESTREATLAAGFDLHLLKPADPSHILSLLAANGFGVEPTAERRYAVSPRVDPAARHH